MRMKNEVQTNNKFSPNGDRNIKLEEIVNGTINVNLQENVAEIKL